MNKITKEAITSLAAAPITGPAVTIYLPTHTAVSSPHMSENQIRLKNLISKAVHTLEARSDGTSAAKRLHELQAALLADQSFWENLTQGMLLCIDDQQVHLFYLPIDTEEYVAVSDSFHLAPVLGLLHDEQAFYVLSIAQHQPQLYRADMYGIQPGAIHLPESVDASLHIDENGQKGEQLQGAQDQRAADRMAFWRLVDQTIMEHADRSLPIILAGVEAESAEYRSCSKHPRLLQQSIHGNMQNTKPEALFQAAKAIVYTELIEPKRQQAMDAYHRMRGTNKDRVAEAGEQLISAAGQGRVDTLLLGLSRFTSDTIQDSLQPAQRITFPQGSMAEAFNAVALAVQHSSGSVVMVDQDALPGGRGMAAILRY